MTRRLSYTYDNHTMISKHRTNLLTRKVSYRGCPWSAHPRTDHGFDHGNTWDTYILGPFVHFGPWAVKCFVRNNHSGDLDAQFMKERICNGRGQNYHKVKSQFLFGPNPRLPVRYEASNFGPLVQDRPGIHGLNLYFQGLHRWFRKPNKSSWIKNFTIDENPFSIEFFLNFLKL